VLRPAITPSASSAATKPSITRVSEPDSRYGVSKAFGEALGSLYADKYGMEVVCMRIGNVNPRPRTRGGSRSGSRRAISRSSCRSRSIAPDPLRDRVRNLRQPAPLVRQLNAERLGYRAQDDSESYAEEILRNEKPGADRAPSSTRGTFVLARRAAIRRERR